MTANRRVFVTGASSGLGHGLARHYAGEGHHLGLVARREPLLRELAEQLEGLGAHVSVYAGDVADTAFMADCAEAFVSEAGGVDLVLANAGVSIKNAVREGESAEIARMLGVNVVGVTNTVVPFVPVMLRQGAGALCAVGSVAGHAPLPGRGAYSASKAAVATFMSSLRMELAGTGVHAMTLCPGFVETPMTHGNPHMMFVIDVDQAVESMVGAIESQQRTFTFPWQMRWIGRVMTHCPESWLRRFAPPPRTS